MAAPQDLGTVKNSCGHEAWDVYTMNRRKDYAAIVERVRSRQCHSCISRSMPKG